MDVARVEVYLDNQDEPFAVLDKPPFVLELDPSGLAEGVHYLIAVVQYQDGSTDHHEYVFEVARKGPVFAGHIARAPVTAPLEVRMVDSVEIENPTRPDMVRHALLPLALFLLLAGTALWLAKVGEKAVPGGALAAGGKVAAAVATGGSQAAPAGGKELYDQHCASCHKPDGSGMPPTFPALAGNQNLADAEYVVKTIVEGKPGTAMPPFGQQLNDAQVAAVASYIRTAWGNSFGPVSEDLVAKVR